MKYARPFLLLLAAGASITFFACVGDSATDTSGVDSGGASDAAQSDGNSSAQDSATSTDGGGADAGGGCDGGQQMCGATCVDVSSESTSCGRCGHDCGAGAKCTKGVCQPVIVTTGPNGSGAITALTTDQAEDNPTGVATQVFWGITGASAGIYQDSVGGGNLIQLSNPSSLPANFSCGSIAVHGSAVYWPIQDPGAGNPKIYKSTAGTATTQVVAGSMSSTASLNALLWDTGGNQLVGSYVPGSPANSYGVFKCKADGSACTSIVVFGGAPSLNMATDGADAFVADGTNNKMLIVTLANGSTTTPSLSPLGAAPNLVRSNGNFLFWSNSGSGTIARADNHANAPMQVASPANAADGLAADSVNVYWTDTATGTVFYAPAGGGGSTTPYVVLGKSTSPMRLVRDKASLFFVHGSSIYRVALP